MIRPSQEISAVDRAVYESYLDHLLAGHRLECRRILLSLVEAGTPLRVIYERLFQDSQRDVGARWETGRASVATEHLATAITEDLLATVFPSAIPQRSNGRTAVVSCVASEFHQIGGRIVADTLELAGWDVRFFGANTPEGALVEVVRARVPDLIALSVVLEAHAPAAERAINLLRAVAPEAPIVVGGPGTGTAGLSQIAATAGDVHLLGSLAELDAWLEARFH